MDGQTVTVPDDAKATLMHSIARQKRRTKSLTNKTRDVSTVDGDRDPTTSLLQEYAPDH